MSRQASERNASIYHGFHKEKKTRAQLAKEYGISEQRVGQIISRMDEKKVLPLTDMELALHVEHDKLEALELKIVDRLIAVRNKRVEVHRRLDVLMASRLELSGGVRPGD